jgi:hypothetical protein
MQKVDWRMPSTKKGRTAVTSLFVRQSVRVFRMILTINSDYFPKKYCIADFSARAKWYIRNTLI